MRKVIRRRKGKPSKALVDQLLGEASWLLSHAEALADYGRHDEATAELLRAASGEEQLACLLDAADREQEAVVHRVSAAACHQQVGQYTRAVTLLRAALSATLPGGLSAEHRTDNLSSAWRRSGQNCLGYPLLVLHENRGR